MQGRCRTLAPAAFGAHAAMHATLGSPRTADRVAGSKGLCSFLAATRLVLRGPWAAFLAALSAGLAPAGASAASKAVARLAWLVSAKACSELQFSIGKLDGRGHGLGVLTAVHDTLLLGFADRELAEPDRSVDCPWYSCGAACLIHQLAGA